MHGIICRKFEGKIWAINQWETYEKLLRNKKLMKFLKPLPVVAFVLIVIAVLSGHENYIECVFGVLNGIFRFIRFSSPCSRCYLWSYLYKWKS